MLLGLLAALGAAVGYGAAAVLQAISSRRVPSAGVLHARLLVQLLREPTFAGAVALNLLGFLLHLVALRTLPLFLAQAGIATSLVFTALLAVRIFGDHLRPADWAAVAATCGGLVLTALAAGAAGEDLASMRLSGGLFLTVIVIAGTGWAVSRSHSPVTTSVLGLLAGVGFGVVGIAARVLPSLDIATLLRHRETYTLPLAGAVAFLLYSVALQRGAVTAVTAPMIAVQTILPSAVGIIALGDAIRSGRMPLAVLGLVLTVAGAVALSRFDSGLSADAPSTPAATR